MHPATAPQHAQPHSHQHPGPHTPSKAKPKRYNPRLFGLFGLANLVIAKKQLMALQARGAS